MMPGSTALVVVADSMSSRFESATTFMQSLVDEVNAEWKRRGVAGADLIHASWNDGAAMIETSAGCEPLTIERVRADLRSSKVAGEQA